MKILFILNEGPYGNERSYNGLRLAISLAKQDNEEVRIFLIGDGSSCAKKGQTVPQGYYNAEIMLNKIIRNHGEIGVHKKVWGNQAAFCNFIGCFFCIIHNF